MEKQCETPGCHYDPKGRKYCGSCRKKQSRQRDPVKYAYDNLLSSARKRKIFCDLTFEEFKFFCVHSEYMAGKGRTIGSYNVDRIIEGPLPGYTATNIQCLDKQKNIRKYIDYNWQEKTARAVECLDTLDDEDMPF